MKSQSVKDIGQFPVKHYSYSSMRDFCTNLTMFFIKHVNRDRFDTAMGASGVLGSAFHKAMEVYYGGSDDFVITNEEEAIEYGMKCGMSYIESYNDGFINWTTTIPNKQKILDLFSFCFQTYIKEMPYQKEELVEVEDCILESIDVDWKGEHITLPIKLKGYIDRIDRVSKKLKIFDYKIVYTFSNPDKIDGSKIIQAIVYYLLVYAKYGEAPYSMTFQEVKHSKNSDGSPQVRQYEIVYEENDLYFDFFFRLYQDITRALNGEMVYVPNIDARYDNEIAIIAYVHRLDQPEEIARLMKKHRTQTLSDLLKKEIQGASNMRKLMKTVEENFVSAKNLNYEKMKPEEKIQTKMMEHGMMLKFDSVIHGASVDLYRYMPSIGLKMSRVKNYTDDVEQVLGSSGIRILAPIPRSTLIGFEVPTENRTFPTIPEGDTFEIAIGQDIMGDDRRFDIRSAPHMLIAGTSGSGKSTFLTALIKQLSRIPRTEIHLFDPKMVELSQHEKDANVVQYESDIMGIHNALEHLVDIMNGRYEALARAKVRSIDQMTNMPYKFVIIDEFGDIMVSQHIDVVTQETGHIFTKGAQVGMAEMETIERNISKEIEKYILLLAQKGRAAGIHVIIATQRPSADIIKGTIKANFPTKVMFRTAKAIDSVVVLDEPGAEKLLGKGDMLFSSDMGIERLQGYNS